MHCLVIGPGLGRNDEVVETVKVTKLYSNGYVIAAVAAAAVI